MTPDLDASTELLGLVTHAISIALDTRSKSPLLLPMCLLVTSEGKIDIIALSSKSAQPTEDFARGVLKGRDATRYVFYYEATVEENGQKRPAIILAAGETATPHGFRFLQYFRKGFFGGIKPVERPTFLGKSERLL